jgi:hypothetical protein
LLHDGLRSASIERRRTRRCLACNRAGWWSAVNWSCRVRLGCGIGRGFRGGIRRSRRRVLNGLLSLLLASQFFLFLTLLFLLFLRLAGLLFLFLALLSLLLFGLARLFLLFLLLLLPLLSQLCSLLSSLIRLILALLPALCRGLRTRSVRTLRA